jgi:hypothetical protein
MRRPHPDPTRRPRGARHRRRAPAVLQHRDGRGSSAVRSGSRTALRRRALVSGDSGGDGPVQDQHRLRSTWPTSACGSSRLLSLPRTCGSVGRQRTPVDVPRSPWGRRLPTSSGGGSQLMTREARRPGRRSTLPRCVVVAGCTLGSTATSPQPPSLPRARTVHRILSRSPGRPLEGPSVKVIDAHAVLGA